MRRLVSFAVGSAILVLGPMAWADESVIKLPGVHPDYVLEAEPRLLVEPFEQFAPGVGFRATVELVDNGFVQTINNTVGLSFGLDWTHRHMTVPVVMQWNFWLSRNWSVLGEPGGVLVFDDDHIRPHPAFYVGGRYHFSDTIALTLRAGHPISSIGLSFFL